MSAEHELLKAILEALDIPSPATVGDGEVHDRILLERVMHVKTALRSELEGHPIGIEWTTEYLRERLADCPPVGYRPWGQP